MEMVVKTNIMEYSNEYAGKFHTALNGMVESQMKAVTATASFWYTAWVNAGKPDLSNLDAESYETQQQGLKTGYKTV
jgi:hypothetical protein